MKEKVVFYFLPNQKKTGGREIRFVSQGVVCFHSVDFGGFWTFTVIFFNDSRGCTLFVSLYISFA